MKLIYTIFIIALFSVCTTSKAQILVDGVSDTLILSATNSLTFSHTCGSGPGRILYVSVICSIDTSMSSGTSATASYNGLPVPLKALQESNSPAGSQAHYIWLMKSPTAGAHNIVINLPLNSWNIMACGVSLKGVDTVNTQGAGLYGSNFNDTCFRQITTLYNNSVLLFFSGMPACDTTAAISLGSAQTPLVVFDNTNGPEGSASIMPAPVAGTYLAYEAGHCANVFSYSCLLEVRADSLLASVGEHKEEVAFSLFPNPSDEYLSIRSEKNTEQLFVTVLDVNGRTVLYDSFYGSDKSLDVSMLNSGVYFLQVKSSKGISRKKFIKA